MQVTITIDNSFSQITGLDATKFNALRKLLSYDMDSSAKFFSGNSFNTVRYLIDNKGNFPTGLLTTVEEHLLTTKIVYFFVDKRSKPLKSLKTVKSTLAFKPYPAQELAVTKAIQAGRGTISMPTGTGKSLVIALLAQSLGLATLVVVPNLEIKKQLLESLNALLPGADITVENIDSSALQMTKKKFDVLIIDEAHHVAAKTYQKLNKGQWAGIYYRFFMTATPFRNNDEETLLFKAIAGDVLYRLTYKEAIAKGYIVPVEAYFIDIPKVKTDAFTWQQVYSELVVNNEARNNAIALLLLRLNKEGKSTLCLVKEIKHGTILSEMTNIPFANGQDEDTRVDIARFNKGAIKALIGTSGILGEGVDTKPCEFVIIAGLGKAKSAFMQQVGRAVRTYPGKESAKVILIRDKSHKFTKNHFNEQVKILLEEYGVEALEINL